LSIQPIEKLPSNCSRIDPIGAVRKLRRKLTKSPPASAYSTFFFDLLKLHNCSIMSDISGGIQDKNLDSARIHHCEINDFFSKSNI